MRHGVLVGPTDLEFTYDRAAEWLDQRLNMKLKMGREQGQNPDREGVMPVRHSRHPTSNSCNAKSTCLMQDLIDILCLYRNIT